MHAAHKIISLNNIESSSYKKLSDEDLMLLFQDGDEGAYNELVRRYKNRICAFICGMLNDYDMAQDLTQDTLFKLYTHKNSYKNIAKFSTWLYTIAKNMSYTELRKKSRRKTYSISDIDPDSNSNISYFQNIESDHYRHESSNIGDQRKYRYDKKILRKKISELPEEFKSIILLRDIQELSYDMVSKIMELPIGTVKSRLNRARIKLKELLEGE